MLSNVHCELLSPDLTQQRKDMARRILLGFIWELLGGLRTTRWQHLAAYQSSKYVKQSSTVEEEYTNGREIE